MLCLVIPDCIARCHGFTGSTLAACLYMRAYSDVWYYRPQRIPVYPNQALPAVVYCKYLSRERDGVIILPADRPICFLSDDRKVAG